MTGVATLAWLLNKEDVAGAIGLGRLSQEGETYNWLKCRHLGLPLT